MWLHQKRRRPPRRRLLCSGGWGRRRAGWRGGTGPSGARSTPSTRPRPASCQSQSALTTGPLRPPPRFCNGSLWRPLCNTMTHGRPTLTKTWDAPSSYRLPTVFLSCHLVALSSCRPIALSSCHLVVFSPCRLTILPSSRRTVVPLCHRTVAPSCQAQGDAAGGGGAQRSLGGGAPRVQASTLHDLDVDRADDVRNRAGQCFIVRPPFFLTGSEGGVCLGSVSFRRPAGQGGLRGQGFV